MSIQTDGSGRRWVSVETEVPGTPEEVWEAIATGPGVTSWFVPMKADEAAGTITHSFGPGMDSVAKRTVWDPPKRCAAESGGLGPNAPAMATEWTVEARSGGTCVVRVVHSLFTSSEDWDDQLESIESGWPALFGLLALYLKHYRGQGCTNICAMVFVQGQESAVWEKLTGALGLNGGSKRADAPALTGKVEQLHGAPHAYAILRLEEPAPGLAFVNACTMGGMVMAGVRLYLYGNRGAEAGAQAQPAWEAWLPQAGL